VQNEAIIAEEAVDVAVNAQGCRRSINGESEYDQVKITVSFRSHATLTFFPSRVCPLDPRVECGLRTSYLL
jgi:hypothetical protein